MLRIEGSMSKAATHPHEVADQWNGHILHLREAFLDILVMMVLLIAVVGVALFDLWGLAKLWHLVFGFAGLK